MSEGFRITRVDGGRSARPRAIASEGVDGEHAAQQLRPESLLWRSGTGLDARIRPRRAAPLAGVCRTRRFGSSQREAGLAAPSRHELPPALSCDGPAWPERLGVAGHVETLSRSRPRHPASRRRAPGRRDSAPDAALLQRRGVRCGAVEDDHLPSSGEELLDEVQPEEASASGDEGRLHGLRLLPRTCGAQPRNRGLRPARKASTPSRTSGDSKFSTTALRSSARPFAVPW